MPGIHNVIADKFSRLDNSHDYALSQAIFDKVTKKFNITPEVDLFASQNSSKLPKFVSRCLDPFSWKTNAFSLEWPSKFYLFPPINLVSHVIIKFVNDKVDHGILITPLWPGLPALSKIISFLIDDPILLPEYSLLGKKPVHHNLELVTWSISCKTALIKAYRRLLQSRCSQASLQELSSHMREPGLVLRNGLKKRGIELVSLYQ